MIRPIEGTDDERAGFSPTTPRNPGEDDARLGGLLSSLSGQVSLAFSQLTELHAEICAEREAADLRERERERELENQRDELAKERTEIDQLRASVVASSAELGRRAEHTERMERETHERRESLSREAKRAADLAAELDRRAALLVARERAVDGFFALLGRMRDTVVAPNVASVEEAAAAVESADPPTAVDISDFSVEEIATFGVRRRLRAYGDAFLAAEIRAERNGTHIAKKKRWF
jgi:hypothetical protein